MTGRRVPEWIGATPDTPAPARVRDRVFMAHGGRCWSCTRKIAAGDIWTLGHKTALINGGENREINLGPECSWCKPVRDREDVAEKATIARKRNKHLGIRSPRHVIPGSKASGWKKPLYGPAVRR